MKRRLCILALFVAVFIGIKEASAQKRTRQDTINSLNIKDPGPKDFKDIYVKGQVDNYITLTPTAKEPYSFASVEVLPKYPGGKEAFNSYFRRKIKTDARANNSRVIVSFIVEKDGSLTNIEILRGLNIEADKVSLKILKKSPKWIPGMQEGKVVRVNYVMPIKFYN